MEKVTGRLSKLQDRGDLTATDSRFEVIEKTSNMELLSKHVNTQSTVKIDKYAHRREPFPAKKGCNSEYYRENNKDYLKNKSSNSVSI